MANYDYTCDKCSKTVEISHSIDAKPRPKCPECKSSMRKMMGNTRPPLFKGAGFYETDYKKKKK